MSLIDRFFGGGGHRDPPGGVSVPLTPLILRAGELAQALENAPLDAALVRARFADRCRDAGAAPVAAADFDANASSLDEGAWRRLRLLVDLLDHEAARAAFARVTTQRGAAISLEAFSRVAREKRLLTPTLLRASGPRVEELTRAWASGLGVAIEGESPEVSRAALERLDYARLMQQALEARRLAAERMKYLEGAQEADDQKRAPRRGKW